MKLRQVEVLMEQDMPRIDAIRQIKLTEQTYYRWSATGLKSFQWTVFPPNKYGGMGTERLCVTATRKHTAQRYEGMMSDVSTLGTDLRI